MRCLLMDGRDGYANPEDTLSWFAGMSEKLVAFPADYNLATAQL